MVKLKPKIKYFMSNDKVFNNTFSKVIDYDIMNKKTTKSMKGKIIFNSN